MKKDLIVIIFIALFLFTIPIYLRYSNNKPLIAGEKSYQLLNENKTPYEFIINKLSKSFNKEKIALILSFTLSIASIIIFYFLLKDFNVRDNETFFILLCFTLSPLFVNLISTPNNNTLILFLFLLTIYLFSKPNNILLDLITPILFFLISLFGITHLIMILATIFVAKNTFKESFSSRKIFYILTILLFIFSIYYNIKSFDYEAPNFIQKIYLKEFISDFGSDFGFSIFNILLSSLGIVLLWSYKSKYYYLYFMLILITIISIFNNNLMIYAKISLSILSGVAFAFFLRLKWQIDSLKKTTAVLLFCGILFSTLSYAVELSRAGPDKEISQIFGWLNKRTDKNSIILSHHSYGFWIEYYSKRKALLTSDLTKKGTKEIYKDYQEILNSYDLERIKELLDKYNIKYIIITKKMKEGLIWDTDEEGLSFMITDTETFKNIYESNNMKIFEYKNK